jgi:hypothetical protein
VQPLAQVRAAPLAHVDTDSEVMLVWFKEDHPAAPAPPVNAAGELTGGSAAMQPQAAPPKPTPAPAAAAPDGDSDDEPVAAPPPTDQVAPPDVAPAPPGAGQGKPAKAKPKPAARKPATPP